MNSNLFRNILIASSLISLTNLNAQNNDILNSISNDMNRFNSVATITKQNEHYQPYIISVFQGKELEKLGILNLKEALQLVPGVDMATDNMNIQTPIFRGSNSLGYGQSKLFIDDVLVNNLFFDSYSEYLGMPIEMIKRIEVVRGPGSKTNGVNAYAGSINVITYAEDFKGFESKDKLVFKYGSDSYRMAGFIQKFKTENLKATIDFYYQKDDKKLYAGPDGYATGSMSIGPYDNTGLSQTGDAPVWNKDYSLGLNLKYKDFTLKGRYLDHTQGSAYGINRSLPRDNDRMKLPNYYLELGFNKKINNFDVEIKAGVKYDAFDSKAKLAPDGLVFMNAYQYSIDKSLATLTTPITFPDGIYGEHLAKQRALYQSSYLTYDGLEKHIITAGYRILKEETTEVISKLSNWSTGDVALVDYTDTYPFFDENAKRYTQIFSLQDQYQYSDKLHFLYGFNYEKTTFENAGFEPRVSMVYQYNLNNIFKGSYSRAHRNPSWQEMFTMNNNERRGSSDLKPEIVDAFELAYIKKFSSSTYLQSNLFYLKNQDQIYNSNGVTEYGNLLDTNIYGVELEYAGNISTVDKLYLNYTYLTGKSKIKDTGDITSLTNAAHHLAKGYYIYNLTDNLSLSGIIKYVSSKKRFPEDDRAKVPAYTTVDTTLNYKNNKDNYDITIGIKNIFDEDVSYPSPPDDYIEDYTQEGRTFFITLRKEF